MASLALKMEQTFNVLDVKDEFDDSCASRVARPSYRILHLYTLAALCHRFYLGSVCVGIVKTVSIKLQWALVVISISLDIQSRKPDECTSFDHFVIRQRDVHIDLSL